MYLAIMSSDSDLMAKTKSSQLGVMRQQSTQSTQIPECHSPDFRANQRASPKMHLPVRPQEALPSG